ASTGFSSEIELGELGPAIDNPRPTLSIRFTDYLYPDRTAVAPNSVVYLRGVPLARYENRVWKELDWNNIVPPQTALQSSERRPSAEKRGQIPGNPPGMRPTTPPFLSPPPDNRPSDRLPGGAPGNFDAPDNRPGGPPPSDGLRNFPDNRPSDQFPGGGRQASQYAPTPPQIRLDASLATITLQTWANRYPTLEALRAALPDDDVVKNRYLYDPRASFVGMELECEPTAEPIMFTVWPFFWPTQDAPVGFVGNVALRAGREGRRKTMYRLLTNAFQNGRQMELTPNAESAINWYLQQYLEFDEKNFPKLATIARAWDGESGAEPSDYAARAQYLASRLRDFGEYTYSREGVERDSSLDPLEDFISEHKSGHCEYFAGALAQILRAVGIPSRVVVGYAFSPAESGKTIVRQSDAHAWVEAFIPRMNFPKSNSAAANLFPPADQPGPWLAKFNDGAWLRLDPTPPSRLERHAKLAVIGASWLLFFQSLWRDYVLNFNGAVQAQNIYAPIVALAKKIGGVFTDFRRNFHPLAGFVNKTKEIGAQISAGDWTPRAVGNIIVYLAEIFIVVFILVKIVGRFRRRARREETLGPKRKSPAAEKAFSFYLVVEEALAAKLNVERRASETPREFLTRCFAIEDERVQNDADYVPTSAATRALFREIVEKYYDVRYGENEFPSSSATEWSSELRRIEI
ncbi:MAG: DUF4129 domain-containing protein, partial [Thermoguttaceae bacterium]|nr:DUF4129 domain-containing protein [Thermoguttaceae bacterium]